LAVVVVDGKNRLNCRTVTVLIHLRHLKLARSSCINHRTLAHQPATNTKFHTFPTFLLAWKNFASRIEGLLGSWVRIPPKVHSQKNKKKYIVLCCRLLAGVEKAERIHLGWHQSPQLLEEGLVLHRFFDVVILPVAVVAR
jgi:hypothetical protein